jgi:hypothetical protein
MNSVAITFVGPADSAEFFLSLGHKLVSQGCSIAASSPRSLVACGFEVAATPLIMQAYCAVRRRPIQASAVIAVRVLLGGIARPSDKTLSFGLGLASEADPGRVSVSLRLAALLQDTERNFRKLCLRPTSSRKSGRQWLTIEGALSTARQQSNLGALVTGSLSDIQSALLERRLMLRLGTIAPWKAAVLRLKLASGDSAQDIGLWLAQDLPTRFQRLRAQQVVDEEFRTIHARCRSAAES